ncbi:MAG: NAD(P)/FAD-dependent oxidoreductase [Anaerolineae bacterium]|nr:NAD(P)/FAD-dependent oxidoreductase [Anaerolineae bacterium]
MTDRYDVVIVGAGPAGIFAALSLSQNSRLRLLLVDAGPDLESRSCPARQRGLSCVHCSPCRLTSGWGGSGAFSDGKLTLSPEVGGRLGEVVGQAEAVQLIRTVDDTFRQFGDTGPVYGEISDQIEAWQKRAAVAGLRLVTSPVRHIGTERTAEILKGMRAALAERGVHIRTGCAVETILAEDGRVTGVVLADGAVIHATAVLVAPGRVGADWLRRQAERLGLRLDRNAVDLGVRVELPAAVLEPLTSIMYEPKLLYYSRRFDDRVRTFCVCPYGEVVTERAAGVTTVNGHSYAGRRTDNTNFAVLVSKSFTEPFDDPLAYGQSVARLANLLGDGVLVQRLGDLEMGRRSTPERMDRGIVRPTLREATPGDLGLVFPYRHLVNILEFLHALDEIVPGVCSRHTLLYGVEVKFYSSRVKLDEHLETEVSNLFAAGDGAGVTRGLVQAAASGLLAAQEIARRLG